MFAGIRTSPGGDPGAPALTVVTGKGGTGKSTITAAAGLAAAAGGRRVLLAETHARTDIPAMFGLPGSPAHTELELAPGLHHVTLDSDRILLEYLDHELPGPVAAVARRSRGLGALVAATPGLRELLTVGKLWDYAQPDRRLPGGEPYDAVIVDAPATGHGIAMFAAPRTFSEAARGGPIHDQAETIARSIADPSQTRFLAVATAEELPVAETAELAAALPDAIPGQSLSLAIVNRMLPRLFSAAERDRLAAHAGAHPAILTALTVAEQRAEQQRQLTALRRAIGDTVEIRTAAALPTADIGPADLASLARAVRP